MGTGPHNHHPQPKKLLLPKVLYILLPLALLHLYFFSQSKQNNPLPPPQQIKNHKPNTAQQYCNLTDGQWAPTTDPPPYNGTSCSTIKPGQNCMAHGRPDTAYLFHRWRPHHCPLPRFHPAHFLHLLRNKHLAFIGDSMARNQIESLLCLLSTASHQPKLIYSNGDDNKFRRWLFPDHNATVSVHWSPFLVQGLEKSAGSGLDHNKLYLDKADQKWLSEVPAFDIMVFSVGHWFLHPAVYYTENRVLGCHHCPGTNHTEIGFFDVFRIAVGTTFSELSKVISDDDSDRKKLVVLTTFSPAHFEGEWDKAGACPKKEPYREGEKEMEYMDAEMRKIEVEEVAKKSAEMNGKLIRFEALDVTRMAMMRPDGHPGPYMNPNPFADGVVKDRVQNDCVHWCLPGPIDAWNEILLAMVKRWIEF